jgi:uncharacterized protein
MVRENHKDTKTQRNDPAIALFAKAPVLGQVKTRLAVDIGDSAALDLYIAFLKDSMARLCNLELKQLGRYLYLTSPWNRDITPEMEVKYQTSGDLGERMKTALKEIFSAGHSSGVVMGTDSPSLPSAYIVGAIEALRDTDCVIGPTEDGGYYLIGFRREAEERMKTLFSKMKWSTETVFSETKARAVAAGLSVVCLPRWYDVDTVAELAQLKQEILRCGIEKSECPNTAAILLGAAYI